MDYRALLRDRFPDYHYPPETSADWKAHWKNFRSFLLLAPVSLIVGLIVGVPIGLVIR